MTPFVAFVDNALAALTVAAQIIIIYVLFVLFNKKNGKKGLKFIQNKSFPMAFTVALVATLGSLFYSEVAGFTPCVLCWYQRILMYPQSILLGMATYKEDHGFYIYSLVLSVLGALMAGYHYWMQFAKNPLSPCSVVGYSISCSERFTTNFGYITIPMMALTAFVLIALLMIAKKR